jgi:hypothetical protein
MRLGCGAPTKDHARTCRPEGGRYYGGRASEPRLTISAIRRRMYASGLSGALVAPFPFVGSSLAGGALRAPTPSTHARTLS